MAEFPRVGMVVDDRVPAIAEGGIGSERRVEESGVAALLAPIHDGPTGQRLTAERAFLRELDGSCETPIAGLAVLNGDEITLRGEVLRPDGSDAHQGEVSGPVAQAAALGQSLAQTLKSRAGPGFFDWHG